MAALHLETVNHEPTTNPLTLVARPKSDILGIPINPKLSKYQFSAPISKVSLPAKDFKRARVTVRWTQSDAIEFDQAGLILVRPQPENPEPSFHNSSDDGSAPYYVKFGLEQFHGAPVCAVAASNHNLDWSISPTTVDFTELTIELMRHGTKLVACVVRKESDHDQAKPSVVRLLSWPLEDVKENDPPIWIGVYASRLDVDSTTNQSLIAHFTDFEVETVGGKLDIFY